VSELAGTSYTENRRRAALLVMRSVVGVSVAGGAPKRKELPALGGLGANHTLGFAVPDSTCLALSRPRFAARRAAHRGLTGRGAFRQSWSSERWTRQCGQHCSRSPGSAAMPRCFASTPSHLKDRIGTKESPATFPAAK
jgi:hypothetical protein